MKPLRLSVQAFGPYLTEQTLDFESLAQAKLFLIHGTTGAGKTSLFDALTYAFYGVGSGDERARPDGLRSDHAPDDLRTEVCLDFSLGEDCYRVVRKAEFRVPRKRGEGFKLEPATAALFRLERDGAGYREAEKIESDWLKVNRAIEALLKLGVKQFRQIVILPQGEFRRFLASGSGDREKILEILFRTTRFKKIQDRLDERVRELKQTYETIESKIAALLKSYDGAENVEGITAARDAAEAQAKELKAAAAKLEAERARAQAALNEAELGQRLLKEKADAAAALALQEARRAEMNALTGELSDAERAEPVELSDERLREARARVAKLREDLPVARRIAEQAAAALKSADEALTSARKQEGEKSRLELRLQALTELGKELRGLEGLEKEAGLAHEALAKGEKAGTALRDQLARAEKSIPELREQENSLRRDCESAGSLRQTLELRRALLNDAAALQGANERYEKIELACTRAEEKTKLAQAAQAKAEEELQKAQDLWVRGQAAILARQLREGEGCPVCGSANHPAPAAAADAEESEGALSRARAELSSARRNFEEAQKESHARATERAAQATLVDSLRERLRAAGFASVEVWQAESKELESKLGLADKARTQLESSSKELERLEAELQNVRAKLQKHEEELRAAQATATRTQTRAEEVRSRVAAQDIKNVDDCTRAWREGNEQLKAIKQQLEKASERREQAFREDAQKQEIARSLEAKEKEEAEAEAKRAAEFRAELSAKGFADEAAYRACLRPRERVREMRQTLRDYETARAAAHARAERAEKEAAGREAVDPAPLAAAVAGLQAQASELSRQLGDTERRIAHAARLLAEIERLSAERGSLHEEYRVLGRMAKVAGGTNEKNMSFQRYVLATFLDEVVESATLRLRHSSKGRYSLRRATEHGDARRSGGLDLVVEDAWHGTVRPVSSLSGGEGFQASLALALGLAEVVQADAGGVYLDAVFIDEGFGTLDSEALDLALRTLTDLQKGGRMVGIISHVPELKQIIPARVEIRADRLGSRIVHG